MSTGVKPTQQKRAYARMVSILDAVERLLSQKDFDQLSIAEIAAEAGVAVGTVYQRFENKEAILPALLNRIRQQAEESTAQEFTLEGNRLEEIIQNFMQVAFDQLKEQKYMMRAIYLALRHNPNLVDDHWQYLEQEALKQTKQILAPFIDAEDLQTKDDKIGMLTFFMGAIYIEPILFPETLPTWAAAFSEKQWVQEMASFAHQYILKEFTLREVTV